MTTPDRVLTDLMSVIEDRKAQRPPNSYTAALLDAGMGRIGEKVLEEAGELVEAAADMLLAVQKHASVADLATRRHDVVHEAADLFYHALVLLAASDVPLTYVTEELVRRFGKPGLKS